MVGVWLVSAAFAQTVTIDLDSKAITKAGLNADEAQAELAQAIEDQLRLLEPERYLAFMAEAAATSMKGMGVDYASNPKRLVFGLSVGTAVAGVDPGFTRGDDVLPPGGYAAQLSLMAGVNLGMFSSKDNFLDRVVLYGNAMSYTPPTPQVFRASFYNVGLHGQVKLIGPFDAKAVEFGGLDVTAGFERGMYTLRLSDEVQLETPIDGGGAVDWRGTGTYTLRAGATSVPLELSTNVRVLILTLYGGVGVDLNEGSADTTAELAGEVDYTQDGETVSLGEARVTITEDAVGQGIPVRAFAGVQINIFPVKLYGHLNAGTNSSFGGHVGVRLVL